MKRYDALVILSGGITNDGKLLLWTKSRLDLARSVWRTEKIIVASGRSAHKRAVLRRGAVITEADAMAKYLIRLGIPKRKILREWISSDTIGNAYFTRTVHTDPARFSKLLVVTSDWHMPRARAIFEWIFGAKPGRYSLAFLASHDRYINSKILAVRMEREKRSLREVQKLRRRLRTLPEIHAWLFTKHKAYATGETPSKASLLEQRMY